MRILIADDDPVYQTLLDGLLKQWGYTASSASDGVAAWELLKSGKPIDLVLMDWMMPRMDGLELCRAIRNDQALRNSYILLLTGSTQKEDIIKMLVTGADDYLIKPFDPMDLKIRLRVAQRIIDMQAELKHLQAMAVADAPVPAGR